MVNITNTSPVVTEDKLKTFYEDIKPFLGCPAYVTQEGDSEYYSTTEKVIGRWADGKPLYQKTINFGALPNSSEKKVSSGLSNVYITFIDGFCKRNGGVFPLSQSSPTSSQWCVALSYDYTDNTIAIATGADRTEFTDCYVTLKYTKTTDSAITTIEQKPTHYSTDEQVVGTWIDGKPIYQKTFTYTGPDITMDTTGRVLEIANISTLNIDKIIKPIEGEARWGASRNPIPISYYAPGLTVFADFLYDRTNELLVLRYCRSSGTMVIGDIVATMTYTKTTD